MIPEISEKHRESFRSLATGWFRIGATCVQLLHGDEVLIEFATEPTNGEASLSVSSLSSGLTLRLHGVTDARWAPNAQTMLEVFSKLLSADADLDNLTAALVETQDRLVALYELTQATRRTLDMPTLLDLLIKQSQHLIGVDGGFVILREKGKKSIIHQVSENPLTTSHIEAAASLYQRDPNRHIFKDSETIPMELRNVMMVSLPVKDEISAAVGLFNKTGKFNTPDIKLAKAIAGHIGAQLENAMLYNEALERTRLETEMNIARQVQTAILPQTIPQIQGVDVYATSTPAFEVGGDFFDVINRSENSLVFALGDVTGKGMPAALLMSMAHTIIKSASRNMPFTHPHQVLNRLNHDMAEDFSNVGMFTTVMVGIIDSAANTLHFSNAGQSPIYYIPVQGNPILLEAQDIPVGILEDVDYTTQSITLTHGDILVVASDGFPESRNPAGEMYDYKRIKALLSASRQGTAQEIAEALISDVNTFCDGHLQDDDRTLIVIKFKEPEKNRKMLHDSLTVKANLKDIRLPCERLRALLDRASIPEETIGVCELALQELLTNLVNHAYKGNMNGQIVVRMAVNGKLVILQTEDTGSPARLNLDEVNMPEPEELAEGGYGMAIIRALMDDVQYETEQGKNVWTLKKSLNP